MTNKNLKPSVLVVEDDEAIVALLEYNLERAGYNVRVVSDGEEALLMVDEDKPDIVLLDWMLPSLTGVQVCNNLRSKEETKNIPIIMISAKGEEADRVDGLESGVDDYLVKPFSPKELLARINAVFRRIRPMFLEKELVYGDIRIDLVSQQVFFKRQERRFGPIEFKLLQALMEHPHRVLSRDQLIRKVWGNTLSVEPRTVDVHINRLRKALDDGEGKSVIRTIRSSGYCLKRSDDEDIDMSNIDDLSDV